MRTLCVLGSTGSIGVNTLDVAGRHPGLYRVAALSANSNVELLAEQCIAYNPDVAVIVDQSKAAVLKERLRSQEVIQPKSWLDQARWKRLRHCQRWIR